MMRGRRGRKEVARYARCTCILVFRFYDLGYSSLVARSTHCKALGFAFFQIHTWLGGIDNGIGIALYFVDGSLENPVHFPLALKSLSPLFTFA